MSEQPTGHWSFRAPQRPELPRVANSTWPRNEIDHFVLARLEQEGMTPNRAAAPAQLLRRVALDLTGLPPEPSDVLAFEADPSDTAYAAYVDRLLDQPAYGEHRARYWLDAARYGDTHGYHTDNYRSIWPYRDYVVQAFATGMPFDRFTLEQLAGDLLPAATPEQRVATGFIRNAMSTSEMGVVEEEYAAIYARDRVETLGTVWMGLTLGCAACHNHKFDPLSQREYYALEAFFRNSTQPVMDGNAADAPPVVMVSETLRSLVTDERVEIPRAHVLARGRYDARGDEVLAGVPAFLPAPREVGPMNRLTLAHWLVDPDHPLTARVTVNRFWSELFGVGIVGTAHDFGLAGEAPTHPELLDWLAVEFVASGWNVKHLFRLMVTSSTYRQSAQHAAQAAMDPDNRLLARGPSFRMDAEMIRDLALAASQLLVKREGGPSVYPYQPTGAWEAVAVPESNTAQYLQSTGEGLYRRSLYTFWKRQAPPPAMEIFNAPSRERSIVQRDRTNTPLQALVALNDVQLVEAARVLATHALMRESSEAARLNDMSMRVLSRTLTDAERAILLDQLARQRASFGAAPDAAAQLLRVGESIAPSALNPNELAAWTMVAQVLLNLDEALHK